MYVAKGDIPSTSVPSIKAMPMPVVQWYLMDHFTIAHLRSLIKSNFSNVQFFNSFIIELIHFTSVVQKLYSNSFS